MARNPAGAQRTGTPTRKQASARCGVVSVRRRSTKSTCDMGLLPTAGKETVDALANVGRRYHRGKLRGLDGETLIDRDVEPSSDAAEAGRHGPRRVARDPIGKQPGFGEKR